MDLLLVAWLFGRSRRPGEPDDSDWLALGMMIVIIPLLVVFGAPYLFGTWLLGIGMGRLEAFCLAGMATTLAVGIGLLAGLWWTVGMAVALSVGSLVGIGLQGNRRRREREKKEEESATWYLSS